jgi:hypothetical protein
MVRNNNAVSGAEESAYGYHLAERNDPEFLLRGKMLKVHLYLLKRKESSGISEVQNALSFSSPSLASHHLPGFYHCTSTGSSNSSTSYSSTPNANCDVPTSENTYYSSPTYAVFSMGIVYLPNTLPATHVPGLYWMNSNIASQ